MPHLSAPGAQVNLRVEAGESLALVGPSGCGKTTALKSLAGFVTPDRGEVLIGGVPLGSFGLATYRAMTGCVLQEDRLFAGSIAENIAGFAEEIGRDWLIECARVAAIDTEIQQMPMGYETLVGDMGSVFSGGQKQRVFLTRALYRKPHVLLLDEATSHLDEANERVINQAVANLSLTRICVAHRLSTIALTDRVGSFGHAVHAARASV
ncbi:ATP-binding cassette domain-containing protein [Roseobacter sinensis]|uniref:ATP-binding cassette domain-containing protein n=1 Tax=Roseobacter sinensis TaxID=2931391 RepID=A0ABT3BIM0_9RHOB|nr:ATP-binding cassette domain-containing protein [Roseobacter sp. WL0113]MCV3273380.1 ATP-binding cassette domain-containing protein [Roseobacter sp. WL0113]